MRIPPESRALVCRKILLVDDVPQGTIARKSVLKDLGYQVETAENAQEALELLTDQTFDLMVTDYMMPGMNGIDLIRCAKSAFPAMRTVMLSGPADTFGFTEEHTGADAVLTKSGTELSQLTRTIKKLLTKKPMRKPAGSEKRKPPLFMVKGS